VKPVQLSIGSWAYCFGPYQANPVPFDTIIEKLGRLGFDGVELGGFPPHPSPASHAIPTQRAELKAEGGRMRPEVLGIGGRPLVMPDHTDRRQLTLDDGL
jgi:sugar phosphate isomerase/epimerase